MFLLKILENCMRAFIIQNAHITYSDMKKNIEVYRKTERGRKKERREEKKIIGFSCL